MARKHIAAFTPPSYMPPYVSINHEHDGRVSIAVRGESYGGVYGKDAVIHMTLDEFSELLITACNNVADILDENR